MEEYHPDEKLKQLWQSILGISFLASYVLIFFILLIFYAVYQEKAILFVFLVISIIEIPLAVILYIWIPYYFKSIKYMVSDDFVRIQQGVFWKNLATIPYEKVQNVDMNQGPIERKFGLGRVLLHTAGYSGQSTAEGIIKGIIDFQKLASVLTDKVKSKTAAESISKPKFESPDYLSVLVNIKNELVEIKELLSDKDRLQNTQ